MARVKKFNEPGAKEDRIRWNKAGTRKWLTVYTVMEYHPKSEAKASKSEEKPKASKPKKPKASKAKPKAKPKTSKAKKTAKPKKAAPTETKTG
ncbi:MAG: hypothetical protein JNM83_07990 [Myxococcales bacterium]|nr:hypothetical protein [Myxococcales bacterium]